MSLLHIAITRVLAKDASPQNSPVPIVSATNNGAAQVLTTSASSQASTVAIPSVQVGVNVSTYVWEITNMGTNDVYLAFGTSPTATSTAGKAVAAGGVRFFSASVWGERVAVINAT